MRRIAIIWKESVYKNSFHCGVCGAEIADKNGNIHPYTLSEETPGFYLCRKCGNPVARTEIIEVPDGTPPGLYGNYDEFKRGDIEV